LVLLDAARTTVRVVMPDGTQWTVPTTSPSVTLSPNGRWLGYRDDSTFVFRDLAGTEVRAVPGFTFPRPDRAWSPGGQWLIGRDGGPLLNLASGRIVELPDGIDAEGAPTDSGDLVRATCPNGERQEVRMRVLHPSDPRRPQTVTFDATWQLRDGEQVVRAPAGTAAEDNARECQLLTGPRDEVYLAVYDTPAGAHSWTDVKRVRAFLVVSLRTGELLRRVDLPPGRTLVAGTQDWPLTTVGGTLLAHHLSGEDQAAQDEPSELWGVDMHTGEVITVARFGREIRLLAPGQAD
jgi:hypothetical protein